MEKVLVLPLFLLLSALTGVCPRSPTEIYVKAGEMVALYCPLNGEDNHRDAELIWTSPTSQEMDQTPNMSSAEQRHRDLLVHGKSLVILNATANHQGNYSCSLGNTSSQLWFRLRVCTKQSRGCEQRSHYPKTCHSQEACPLDCPDVNTPAAITLNITSNGVIWYREGESSPKASNFSSVEEKNHGVYTCTRSYLYYGKIYNMTFTVVLDIQPKEKRRLPPAIISPQSGVIHVNLGSPKVIDCKARMYSDFDEVFWFSSDSFVETNSSFPVFYNYTKEINGTERNITASLVFKKVSDEDLLKNYTCKLQTVNGRSTSVTISLSQKRM
ncbi:interleukin-1 receptor accessory protein-like [Trematomus bernacchii]|uniref:interleukin-1 receptor accessory protein-like n=1 Tax=Trematomus bernacchii TaxID=40690 RepID=UPI00146A8BA6|nr:interleukin-1 receptor accessory protein-like [Trematomus bernacchii]